MNKLIYYFQTQVDCEQQARTLAHCIRAPLMCGFSGDLGAGKTTFIRALLRELGITSSIKSPTFSLVESYECKGLQLHHLDLYRIVKDHDLEALGFREYCTDNAICLIEWPERAPKTLSLMDLQFTLDVMEDGQRHLLVEARSAVGKHILSCLEGKS